MLLIHDKETQDSLQSKCMVLYHCIIYILLSANHFKQHFQRHNGCRSLCLFKGTMDAVDPRGKPQEIIT